MAALGDKFEHQAQVDALEQTAQRLQRELAQAKAKSEALVKAVKEAAFEAAVVTGRPKPVPRRKAKDSDGEPEEAVLHLTDWQLGKRTADYDTEVCIERIRTVVEKARRITDIQRKDHPVPGATVMFGGDHVEGVSIFPGQAYEVDSTSYAQLMAAAGLMSEVVLTLLQDFDHVTVHSVPGNHGRIGRRGDMPRHDNLDNIAYAIARNQLAGQDRVTWEENLSWYAHVVIGRWSSLLVHGDQVKNVAGTPMFALARRATAWSSSMPFKWTDMFVGHYHQNLVLQLPSGGMVRMTPATESSSEFASEFMAAKGRPGQRLLYVHPGNGTVTSEYLIWLD